MCNNRGGKLGKQYSNPLVGALIIRIGFRGILYYNDNKGPQNNIGNYYIRPLYCTLHPPAKAAGPVLTDVASSQQ